MTRFAIGAALAIVGSAACEDHNAPAFLSARRAVEASKAPPDRWSATENVLWKVDVPGLAWSSPIVWRDRIFLTTCVSAGAVREPRKGLYLEDLNANAYPPDASPHSWRVLCLDLNTGKALWERVAHEGVPPKPHHIKNTLASETPTTDGERLYAYFGNVGLYCYDLSGRLLWERPVPARDTRYGWGTSSSPVVHRGRLYLQCDTDEDSRLLCIDARSGEDVWSVEREEKTNYATPFVWEYEGRTELVTSGVDWARSYDLDGTLLWRLKGRSILAIPTPFAEGGLLYLTSGHVAWGNNPFYAIKPGASGDISPDPENAAPLNEHLAWHLPKAGPYHPTPLVEDGLLYILYDRGLLACHDARTGREVYPRKRLPHGAGYTSSPWSYRGRIFCLNEDGGTVAVAAGLEFKILHVNELAEDDMCMATPAVVGSKLLIRSSARLYCIAAPSESRVAAAAPE